MCCGVRDMQRKKQRVMARSKFSVQQKLKKKRKTNDVKEQSIKADDNYFVAVVFHDNGYALREFDDPSLVSRILDEINERTNQTKPLPSTAITPLPNEDTYPVKTFWTNYEEYSKGDCNPAMDKVLSLLEAEIGDDSNDFLICDSYHEDDNGFGAVISPHGCDDDDDGDDEDEETEEGSDSGGEEDDNDGHNNVDHGDPMEEEPENIHDHSQQKTTKKIQTNTVARSITTDFGNEDQSKKEEEEESASLSSSSSRSSGSENESKSSERKSINDQDDDASTQSERSTSSSKFGDDGTVDDEEEVIQQEQRDAVVVDDDDDTNQSSTSESEIDLSPIKREEPWCQVWEKFKEMGWNWKWRVSRIGIDERAYYMMDGSKPSGKRYWTEVELKNLAESEYGWSNPEKKLALREITQNSPLDRSSTPTLEKKRKRSPQRNDKAKDSKKHASKKAKASKTAPQKTRKENKKAKSLKKQRIWGKEVKSKPTVRHETTPVRLNLTNVWNYLKSKGWRHIASKNPLHDNWYYLKPNVQHDRKRVDGIEGQDYFITADSLLEYLQNNEHYLSSPDSSSSGSSGESENETSPQLEPLSPNNEQVFKDGCQRNDAEIYCTPNSQSVTSKDEEDIKDDSEVYWWKSVPIPDYCGDIKPILIKMSKANMLEGRLPRSYLCSHGIYIKDHGVLDKDEMETLSKWLSITHLPNKVNGVSIGEGNSLDVLPDIPVLNSNEAWSLLCEKFNCKFHNGQYHIHCAKDLDLEAGKTVTCFKSLEDARVYLRSHGIEDESVDNRDVVSIMLWASLADVNPFNFVEPQDDCEVKSFGSTNENASPSRWINDTSYAKCWWLESEFPPFSKVWSSLRKVVKYSKRYSLKSKGKLHNFDSPEQLRIFISLNGLEVEDGDMLSNVEQEIISRWVSTAHLPTRINEQSISSQAGVDVLLEKAPIVDSDDAWALLCSSDYGSKIIGNQFHVPRVGEIPIDPIHTQYFDTIEDVRKYIRSHGIERVSKNNKDNVDHARLILWASLADVNPFIDIPTPEVEESKMNDEAKASDNSHKDSEVPKEVKSKTQGPTIISSPTQKRKRDDNQESITMDESGDQNEERKMSYDEEEKLLDNEERRDEYNSGLLTQSMESNEQKEIDFQEMIQSYKNHSVVEAENTNSL